MKGWKDVPEERCGTCKHFYRHYGHTQRNRYYPLRFVHCTYPRPKNRWVEEYCPYWTDAHEEAPRDP